MTIEIDPSASRGTSFLKRVLLRMMLILVAVGVAVAIYAVLRGEPLGEALAKIMYTALGTGIYAALALGCADAAERRWSVVAHAGIVTACVAVAVFFAGIWFDQARHDWWWKALSISSLYTLAFWRAARFTLARVEGLGAAVAGITSAAGISIATIITLMILRERAEPGLVRMMNALWIVCIGGHVAVPILEKLQQRTATTTRVTSTGAPGDAPPGDPPTSPPAAM